MFAASAAKLEAVQKANQREALRRLVAEPNLEVRLSEYMPNSAEPTFFVINRGLGFWPETRGVMVVCRPEYELAVRKAIAAIQSIEHRFPWGDGNPGDPDPGGFFR